MRNDKLSLNSNQLGVYVQIIQLNFLAKLALTEMRSTNL